MEKLYQLNSLAQYCENYGDYETAEKLFFQLVNLKGQILGRTYAGCSTDLYNLGLLNYALNDYSRAKRLLIRALQIQKQEKKNKHLNVVETLQVLAQVRREKSECSLKKVS